MWAALPLFAAVVTIGPLANPEKVDARIFAFSPDGRTLAVCPDAASLILYDTTSWKPRVVKDQPCSNGGAISFENDDTLVVVAPHGGNTMAHSRIDVRSAKVALRGGSLSGDQCALSRDRTRVAIINHCRVSLYALPEGTALVENDDLGGNTTSGCVSRVDLGAADRLVASWYGGGLVRVLGVESPEKPKVAAEAAVGAPRAFLSPDGQVVAVGRNQSGLELRRASTLKLIARVALPFDVQAIAFSSDGKRLAVGGSNLEENDEARRRESPEVQILDARSGRRLTTVPGAGPSELGAGATLGAAFSHDGRLLVVGGFGGKIFVHRLR